MRVLTDSTRALLSPCLIESRIAWRCCVIVLAIFTNGRSRDRRAPWIQPLEQRHGCGVGELETSRSCSFSRYAR
jgi:hypothetical protein